ncbi:MAG: alkaline phosphatase D family protein [Bdellovibrionales bacterium]
MRIIVLLPALIFWVGCTTAGKRLSLLDQAFTEGPESLSRLCREDHVAACSLTGQAATREHILPIMQGISSAEQARFVVDIEKGKSFRFYLQGNGRLERLNPDILEDRDSDVAVAQLEAFHLTPGQDYLLTVVGPNARVWDQRRFRSLNLSQSRGRLALVSCMDDDARFDSIQAQMWSDLAEMKPDLIVMLGDNVYVDRVGTVKRPVTHPSQIWERYAQLRSRLKVYRLETLIPVIATWDDHDYGVNDGDRTFPFKTESREIFLSFFPQKKSSPGFERGPGVASWVTLFGGNMALLDDRFFRSPDLLDSPDQTHFGVEQEKWLNQKLALSKTAVFLASGDQFFGGYHQFESFEGSHPRRFKEQLNEWRQALKVPALFLSGDRHLSEVIKVGREHLGFSTFEITSSGIHATVHADAFEKAPSPAQVVGVPGEYNYSILEVMQAGRFRLKVDVKAFSLNKKLLYQKLLVVKK